MTVPARWPERNPCIARTIASRSRPARRTTGEVTRAEAGWQPEHAAAPGGGWPKAVGAVTAAAIEASPIAAARAFPTALDHRDAVVLERERADALAGGREVRVQHRRGGHADRRLAHAAPEPAGRHDDRLDLRHLRDAHRIVGVEVRLLDAAVLDRALLHEETRQPVDERAGNLPLDLRRVDGVAGIGRAHDAPHLDLVAAGHRDLGARGHVAAERHHLRQAARHALPRRLAPA